MTPNEAVAMAEKRLVEFGWQVDRGEAQGGGREFERRVWAAFSDLRSALATSADAGEVGDVEASGWERNAVSRQLLSVTIQDKLTKSSVRFVPAPALPPPEQALAERVERLTAERDAFKLSAEYESGDADAAERLKRILDEHAALKAALKPFATVGRIIDGPFGPALFAEDEMAFKSGCAWSENGVNKTLTWGDFRAAAAALNPPVKP